MSAGAAALRAPRRPPPPRQGVLRADRPELVLVPARRPWVRRLAAAVLAGALGVIGVVSLNALAAQSSVRSVELEHETFELRLEVEQLTADVALLEAPEHVLDRAAELGMVPARDPAWLSTDPDRLPPGVALPPGGGSAEVAAGSEGGDASG